jgi:hypothetical protein
MRAASAASMRWTADRNGPGTLSADGCDGDGVGAGTTVRVATGAGRVERLTAVDRVAVGAGARDVVDAPRPTANAPGDREPVESAAVGDPVSNAVARVTEVCRPCLASCAEHPAASTITADAVSAAARRPARPIMPPR